MMDYVLGFIESLLLSSKAVGSNCHRVWLSFAAHLLTRKIIIMAPNPMCCKRCDDNDDDDILIIIVIITIIIISIRLLDRSVYCKVFDHK